MKYINNSFELTKEFKRLLTAYDNYYWMVAWAGDTFPLTNILSINADKIRQLVVGLHFYQTHPSFIEEFNPHSSVKFIKATSGIFHSKVYLFSNNDNDWELLVGSSNFTNAGFNTNNEACILVKSNNSNNHLYIEVTASINDSWSQAKKFTDEEFQDYKISWANQKQKIDSLSGYKRKQGQKQFYQIPIISMPWRQYLQKVYANDSHGIAERLQVLDLIKRYFFEYQQLKNMPPKERKAVAGFLEDKTIVDFMYFGSMKGSGYYKELINANAEILDDALNEIPATGIVTKLQYDSYVKKYQTALGGNKVASATRLLTMKRPDVFVCLSSKNRKMLSLDFAIKGITTMTLERYWSEIILKIYEADWWVNPKPRNSTERKISNYCAAFLDAIYYRR